MMKLLKHIFTKKARTQNVRVKNLVFEMVEYRQSPSAIEIDLLHKKERAAR